MSDATLLAVFLAGLLGGGHCAAMCGGIVGALASRRSARVPLQLAYNAGRIGTYCVAGSLAGAIGGVVLLRDVLPVQLALYVLANLLLLSVGLYIAGWPTLVRRLEIPGQWIWRRISPLTGRFLPADTLPRALALGSIWGWLPCGLTYSVLAIALVSGSGMRGASLMLAFGLGTLPNLLAAGLLMRSARPWCQRRLVRRIAGCIVLGFGVTGLAHATYLGDQLRRGVLCLF
jgi:sulfite exporter TauE/SafE